METGLRDISDIFEVNTMRGLSQVTIQELPISAFNSAETSVPCTDTSCAICLQVALRSILFDLYKES